MKIRHDFHYHYPCWTTLNGVHFGVYLKLGSQGTRLLSNTQKLLSLKSAPGKKLTEKMKHTFDSKKSIEHNWISVTSDIILHINM